MTVLVDSDCSQRVWHQWIVSTTTKIVSDDDGLRSLVTVTVADDRGCNGCDENCSDSDSRMLVAVTTNNSIGGLVIDIII